VIEIVARHDGPAAALTLASASEPWSRDEVWVFKAFPALRQVTISGPAPIDPQQTTLPDEWKSLPAYTLHAGDTLRLDERRRGDSDPAPDQLSLRRTIWLDFDGSGYSIRDRISGAFVRGWRLEMPAPAVLGRVAVEGADQVITRKAPEAPPGIEIRQAQAEIEADSRIPQRRIGIPAVGWDADFQNVDATLRVPPGWRVLHAGGVDDVDATWISAWTLLDLFLVLLTTVAAARLWGRNAGLLALAALGLSWIEWGAPRWSWLAIVAAAALARVLPEGRLKRGAILLHLATAAVLLLALLPFLVGQVRSSLYPSLEQPMQMTEAMGGGIGEPDAGPGYDTAGDLPLGGMLAYRNRGPRAELDKMESTRLRTLGYNAGSSQSVPPPPPPVAEEQMKRMSSNLAPDPKATAQTGPGLPDWRWRRVALGWRGPVTRGQELRLWLVPPAVNALLGWLRTLLLAALALVVMPRGARGFGLAPGSGLGSGPGLAGGPAAAAGATVALLLFVSAAPLVALASSTPAHADMPAKEMLDTLRERLLEPPDCGRECVSCPRLALEATRDTLRLRIEIDAAAAVAVPLAGNSDQWTPARVLLDGQPAPGLARGADGSLWIALAAGTHQVVLEGRLPDRDVVPLPMAIHPRRVTAHAEGWRVDGLREDGQAEETIQLTRERTRDASGRTGAAGHPGAGPGTLEPGTMPPFVRVERELEIGLQWAARTRVTRLTPSGTAILVEVPLLPGESVTSSDVRVSGSRAIVSLAPDVAEISWSSSLTQGAEIPLRAPESVPWIEIWRAAVGPVWHLEAEGIPAIGADAAQAVRTREWHPWPGEALRLRVTRPQPIDGRTLTFDGSTLTLTPGLRVTDASLQLFARASRGGDHTVTLPAGAVLQAVAINGTQQPIRQDGARVTLPIVPGRQAIRVDWREPRGVTTMFRAPAVDLGLDSVNTETVVAMPQDRWTLFVGGPRLGPAVLFWGLLVVNLLVALGLGRLSWTPLRARHWFLLGLGLTQVPLGASLTIMSWLLALGWRRREPRRGAFPFDALQLLLAAWSAVALVLLFGAVKHGLLGLPDMQIAGHGSSAGHLSWFLDRTGAVLPRPWVVSLPLFIYRLATLAWALWLALAVVRWLKWGWECLIDGGLWKPLRRPRSVEPPVVAPPPAVPPSPVGAPAS
jgi:hypothetical protein